MVTQAYSSYGTEMRLSNGVPSTAGVLTDASNTTPIIVTLVTPHGVIDVSWATVAGVVGNEGANGSFVVEAVSANQLRLRGSVGTGDYVAGGTLVLAGEFFTIAELRDIQDAGSRTDLIDVSSHDNDGYSSEIPTLKRTNTIRLDLNFVPNHPLHDEVTGLMGLYASGAYRDWLLVLPPYPGTGVKAVGHLYGGVSYYTMPLPVNGAVQQQVELVFDGEFRWSG
jgi:hypothetical protein